jgi:hypothetical protein
MIEKEIFFKKRKEWTDTEMFDLLTKMGYKFSKMDDAACEMAINE